MDEGPSRRTEPPARSSNWRETTAITRAFFSFRTQIRTLPTLLIQSDNTTAVSALRRYGARWRHIGEAIEPVLRASFRWRVHLIAEHIPGESNTTADFWSRLSPGRNEWALRRSTFRQLCQQWQFVPSIDLFATHQLHLCPRFASWKPDPLAAVTDAFSIEWAHETPVLVPPINLIPKVIGRLLVDAPRAALLVTPYWPSKTWFGTIKTIARSSTILSNSAILTTSSLLRDGTTPPMMAWLL